MDLEDVEAAVASARGQALHVRVQRFDGEHLGEVGIKIIGALDISFSPEDCTLHSTFEPATRLLALDSAIHTPGSTCPSNDFDSHV